MKKAQRQIALSRRRSLTAEQRKEMSAAICEKILAMPELENAKTVFSYLAAWDEVDLSYVNQSLSVLGVTVAYPVCFEKGRMEAYVPEDDTAIETAAYGIKSPVAARSVLIAPAEIDLVLVPCVAFDGNFNRLGHGAGYYDHYLPRCCNVKYIAPAFEAQHLDFVSTDDHDIKMDMVITESAVY